MPHNNNFAHTSTTTACAATQPKNPYLHEGTDVRAAQLPHHGDRLEQAQQSQQTQQLRVCATNPQESKIRGEGDKPFLASAAAAQLQPLKTKAGLEGHRAFLGFKGAALLAAAHLYKG